jgi:adenosine deaminase
VASEICEDAASEGVTTLELRFAPQLHGGVDPSAIVDAALEGVAGRAGLILCGLYGESPSVLDGLIDVAIPRAGVVGIDLAGGPTESDDFGMADYCGAFARARDAGLGRTVHAGEGRPPEEIRFAIESLFAQRIGHGTSILDDPEVVALARDRGVVIEACPTSNVHTGIIERVADHPMATWIDRGLLVCINTDNTFFSRTDAGAERERCLAIDGMTPERIREADAVGRGAAFSRS